MQILRLSSSNYVQWSEEITAVLRLRGLWGIVSGTEVKPVASETEKVADWLEKHDKALGALFLTIAPDQRIHIQTCKSDAKLIWTTLRSVHLSQRPGARFNAYDDLFSIRKGEEETLASLMNRIDEAILRVQNLRPDTFDITKLDEELVCMTMIRSLPSDYTSFSSSLLLLEKMDRSSLQAAFRNEEINRMHRSGDVSGKDGASALRTFSKPPRAGGKPS
ncbi:hypothetical protein EWM64_g9394, partial [Hericium alpestre]